MKVDASVTQPFSQSVPPAAAEPAPSLGLMHAVFVLAGLGTLLLGPILPLLSRQWGLFDSQAGQLLLAQFCGATLGGVTVSSRLARDLLIGLFAAAIGFAVFAAAVSIPTFAFAAGFYLSLPALVVGGFGVGRVIATVNIIAGARYTANRGSSLMRLNFTWSFGALLSPLLAAWLTPHFTLRQLLFVFYMLFFSCAIWLIVQIKNRPAAESETAKTEAPEPRLAPRFFLYFAALIFVYGGLETCLAAWLTTYALRYGQTSLVLSQYTLVLLLCGLTGGRALASWLLVKMNDQTLQRVALAFAAALAAGLATAHNATVIATLAVILGVALAPIFPATFSLLMAHRPPARTAGIVLAASGIGAAALPWLMGVISTRANSLQLALVLPVAAAIAMLLMSMWPRPGAPSSSPSHRD